MITKDFILGGRAVFTVELANSIVSHYTYKVERVEFEPGGEAFFFASLLTGSDNSPDSRDYTYLGKVAPKGLYLNPTKKTPLGAHKTPAWRVLCDVLAGVALGRSPGADVKGVEPAGWCSRCGRTLTTPESIATGLGPVCAGMGELGV